MIQLSLTLQVQQHPPRHPLPNASEIERRVWSVIQQHQGRAQAILSRDVEQETGLSVQEVSEAVKRLVSIHHCRIGSALNRPAGFYVIETPEEAQASTGHLRARALSMLHRASVLQRVSLDEVYGQGKLELEREAEGVTP